eukprot:m.7782 g.7782  ORF g.7782 m.7782 type:complete len:412 (+) comp8933_c0_seq1:66-1301(+)
MLARKSYDVVIAGAGIIGLHAAKQIKRRVPDASVLVVDKASGLAAGSSGYSSAVLRCRYSFATMTEMAVLGLSTHTTWQDYVELKDCQGQFTPHPIVWLVPGQDWNQDVDRLQQLGLRAETVTTTTLSDHYPLLGLEDLDPCANHLVEHSSGYFDPSGALLDLAASCKQAGVELAFRKSVVDVGLHHHGHRAEAVQFGDGSSVSVGNVINCLGPWCDQLPLARDLSARWDIKPVRIQAVHKPVTQADLDLRRLPIVCDGPNGVYFRPQLGHDHIVVSTILPEEEREVVDPDAFNSAADPESRTRLLSGLHARVPTLEARGSVHGYAALYTMNRRDGHPVVGQGTTAVDNYYVANAFTGHGFKLSPVVGDILAYQLTGLTTHGGGTAMALQRFGDLLRPNREPLWDQVSVVA